MARQCTICTHPQRGDIDLAILGGALWVEVARRFDVSERAVGRHASNHLKKIVRQFYAGSTDDTANFVEQLRNARRRILALVAATEQTGDLRLRMYAIDRLHRQANLEANLIGELSDEIDIAGHPRWLAVRSVIMRVLEPYPEIRQELADALADVDV